MPDMVDCPFCGADQKSLTKWGESTIGGYYRWVQCQECHAQGPSASSKAHGQDSDETDAAAIEKWNDQWALQYLTSNVAAAAPGAASTPIIRRNRRTERDAATDTTAYR